VAGLSEIAAESGLNRRTVRKYLTGEAPTAPPQRMANGQARRKSMVEEFAPLIDAMLRAEILIKASVVHERLVAEYGFTGSYQRIKLFMQQARPRVAEELGIAPDQLAGLHRRFEVIPGAQAQVDWGDEGKVLAHVGVPKVYSFHMTLSYSRDPFCCFTTSQNLATFFECHRRAFEHFGGVPMAIVYDRTKTPWSAGTWPRGGRCRCIRRRWRSPGTTTSTSMYWPPTARPGRAGSSGRC
jgi:transposase